LASNVDEKQADGDKGSKGKRNLHWYWNAAAFIAWDAHFEDAQRGVEAPARLFAQVASNAGLNEAATRRIHPAADADLSCILVPSL
jgi:hypothetical protein